MPLSSRADRKALHTRTVICQGFQRADGLWEVEGRIVDTKTYLWETNEGRKREAGTPLHDMSVRLTLDDDLVVLDVEACTDASPFAICPEAAPGMAALKGLRIAAGWNRAVKQALAGAAGCTHLMELLGPVATTAYQTISALRRSRDNAVAAENQRPKKIDSCYAYRSDSEVIARRWPQFYTGPAKSPGSHAPDE